MKTVGVLGGMGPEATVTNYCDSKRRRLYITIF